VPGIQAGAVAVTGELKPNVGPAVSTVASVNHNPRRNLELFTSDELLDVSNVCVVVIIVDNTIDRQGPIPKGFA